MQRGERTDDPSTRDVEGIAVATLVLALAALLLAARVGCRGGALSRGSVPRRPRGRRPQLGALRQRRARASTRSPTAVRAVTGSASRFRRAAATARSAPGRSTRRRGRRSGASISPAGATAPTAGSPGSSAGSPKGGWEELWMPDNAAERRLPDSWQRLGPVLGDRGAARLRARGRLRGQPRQPASSCTTSPSTSRPLAARGLAERLARSPPASSAGRTTSPPRSTTAAAG